MERDCMTGVLGLDTASERSLMRLYIVLMSDGYHGLDNGGTAVYIHLNRRCHKALPFSCLWLDVCIRTCENKSLTHIFARWLSQSMLSVSNEIILPSTAGV